MSRYGVCLVLAVGCGTSTHNLEPALTATWDPQSGSATIAMQYAWFDGEVAWPTMLGSNQHVIATFAGQQVELMPGDLHVGSYTEHGYVATVPVAIPDGLAVSVAVDGIPEAAANATFPGGFDFTTNVATSVSRTVDLVINWSPIATDTMGYSYSGDCLATDSLSSGTYADLGTLKFQRGIFVGTDSCDVTLTIERIRDGETSPGGVSEAMQQRTIHFTSVE